MGSVTVRDPAVGVTAPPIHLLPTSKVFLMLSLLLSVVRLQRSKTAFIPLLQWHSERVLLSVVVTPPSLAVSVLVCIWGFVVSVSFPR